MSQPFNMDTAAQQAQTMTFHDLVDSTVANNNQLSAIADTALAANQGRMSVAFQGWLTDLKQAAMHNNQVLDSITQALGFGIQNTDSVEESNQADFAQLTGQVSSPFGGGSHFS